MAQMPIPDDWNGIDYCCYLVTWPNSTQWNGILTGFITTPTRGRFWDAGSGSIADAQAIGDEIVSRTIGECNYMACLDDLVQIIAAAGGSSGGCGCGSGTGCGSGGVGSTEPPPNPTDTDDEGQAPPLGFPDWATYKTYKCNAAQLIVDDMQEDLSTITTLSFAGQVALGLAIGLAPLLLTPAALPTVIALGTLLLAAAAVGGGLLTVVKDFFDDNEQDFVCALFAGNNTQESIDVALAKLEELADAQEPTFPNNFYIKQIIGTLFTPSSVNRMVVEETLRPLPTGDCSDCPDCVVLYAFDSDQEGFTFADVSDPNGQAIGTYQFGTGSIRVQLIVTPATANETAQGIWTKDLSSAGLTVNPGDTLEVTVGATGGDGGNVNAIARLVYDDATSEQQASVGSGARTITLTTAVAKTVDRIEVDMSKTTGGASTFDVFIDTGRVELFLQDSPCV